MSRLRNPKVAAIGLVALALVVGIAGYLMVISPQQAKASKLADDLATAHSQILVPHTPEKAGSADLADLFRLSRAMPDDSDVPGVLLDISQLAKASSVTVGSVLPSATITLSKGYAALPVSVTIEGKFPAITGFLGRLRHEATVRRGHLEVGGRLFVANQVSLSTADDNLIDATIMLDAFVYAPPPAPKAVDPAAATPANGSAG